MIIPSPYVVEGVSFYRSLSFSFRLCFIFFGTILYSASIMRVVYHHFVWGFIELVIVAIHHIFWIIITSSQRFVLINMKA
jgi:hypothetical protein